MIFKEQNGTSSKKDTKDKSAKATRSEASLYPVLEAKALLKHHQYQHILKRLRNEVDAPDDYFDELYMGLIERFAEFVQLIPLVPGGALGSLLDHGLRRAYFAFAECLSDQQKMVADKEQDMPDPLWLYAAFTAGLLIEVPRILSGRMIIIAKRDGEFVDVWQPFKGTMVELEGEHYYIRPWYGPDAAKQEITPLIARQLMGEMGFTWLAADRQLFAFWLATITDQVSGGGGLKHFIEIAKKKLAEILELDQSLVEQDVEILEPEEVTLAERFWTWLKDGLADKSITVNEKNSHVHRVAEGVFLEFPQLFAAFAKYDAALPMAVVIFQQYNHLGFAKLSGYDHKSVQYFAEFPETIAKGLAQGHKAGLGQFMSRDVARENKAEIKEGILLVEANMLWRKEAMPAVNQHVRRAASHRMAHQYPTQQRSPSSLIKPPQPLG